jgi:hypothetical protein
MFISARQTNQGTQRCHTVGNSIDTDKMTRIPTLRLPRFKKKQFVDKQKCSSIHPLPLLTAEGNGNGGGDYYGENKNMVGIWARDIISISDTVPEGFTELKCVFMD